MRNLMESERLYLRELEERDFERLYEILSDRESMKFYPNPFSKEKVEQWISWNRDNYKKYNHGLWAVILKSSNCLIGDCGITIQNIDGEFLPELCYHIHRDHNHYLKLLLDSFSEKMKVDQSTIAQCTYIDCVLGYCWTLEGELTEEEKSSIINDFLWETELYSSFAL